MPDIDKIKVRAAFDRAAESYDAIANFQHGVCDHLAKFLAKQNSASNAQSRILDAGCGTGHGAQLLQRLKPDAAIIACDLASAMVQKTARHGIETVCADIEHLPFEGGSFDLCWSSLTLQWCDLALAFSELWRVLDNQGELVFSTLGPGTLQEIEFAFKDLDPYRHVLSFCSIEEISAALATAGFSDIQLRYEIWTTWHTDIKSLLTSIRGIGANQLGTSRRHSFMGKTVWQNVQIRYETLRSEEGLPASYMVIFGTAKKMHNAEHQCQGAEQRKSQGVKS